jgi:hypothetical protein
MVRAPARRAMWMSSADINAILRGQVQGAQSQAERFGMRFFLHRVAAAYVNSKGAQQPEVSQLLQDAVAVAAGDQAQSVVFAHIRKQATCSGKQLRFLLRVFCAPGNVGIGPAALVQPSGAVDVVPVGRVVEREVFQAPRDFHFAKHREIGCRVCRVRIQQRAVPIE